MFWVLQDNIYKEQKHSILIQTLTQKNIPFMEVKVVPFFDKLLPSDFDSHGFTGAINEAEEALIPDQGPIMVLGSTTLCKIAKHRGWEPGSFLNDNFHYRNWVKVYGNHLLNPDAIVDTFRDIVPNQDEFFVRPCEDNKDFNGMVYQKEDFEAWRKEVLSQPGGGPFSDHEIMISSVKVIDAEYRFFIVDGKVVTYSQYKVGNQVKTSPVVPLDIITFAQDIVDRWQPAKAFVLDIASTPLGYKVIEVNNFNSAGFYDADVELIIDAIDKSV